MAGEGPVLHVRTSTGVQALDAERVYRIGRDADCDVVVDHPLVSRHHGDLARRGDGWVLVDRGSRNGVWVGGVRMSEVVVAAGSRVEVSLGDAVDGVPVVLSHVAADDLDTQAMPLLAPPGGASLGRLTQIHDAASGTLTIGRSSSCDIVLDDLLVSRVHARLTRTAAGGFTLVDRDSHNGTFVNGRRTREETLRTGDVLSIGPFRLRITATGIEQYEPTSAMDFAALGLTVRSAAGAVLLDEVSFALDAGSFLGVVGPSGAGKSTLIGALTGLRPAQTGTVRFGGGDLYADYDALRQNIGFVPQDDVLHLELTVEQALSYAAELRFPADVRADERRARVDEVLDELGLTARRKLRISKLSGGQRKRVSVALELLTRPAVLVLDEPTSGLDPGYERSLMELLRSLADSGRTVIVVTHSVESLHLCDRVMVLAVGGRVAYLGPPQLAPATLGLDDYHHLFQELSAHPDRDWAAQFRATVAHDQYVRDPLSRYGHQAPVATPRSRSRSGPGWFRQLSVLTRRYLRVLVADTRALVLLLASAPVLGVLITIAVPDHELEAPPVGQIRLVSQAAIVLLILAITATLLGAANAIREIVKELPILRRERAVGLSVSAYVTSKLLVLTAATCAQLAVLTPIALARQGGPDEAVALGNPLLEVIAALALTGVAAVAIGLLVSSVVSSTDQAMTFLPLILVAQLVLTAAAVLPGVSLRTASVVSSTNWGFAATASTSELNVLNAVNRLSENAAVIDVRDPLANLGDIIRSEDRGEPRWNHDRETWLTDAAIIVLLTAAFVAATGVALRRLDPL